MQHTTRIVKKINLISNKSFKYYNLVIDFFFDAFVQSLYLIIFLFVLYTIHLKRRNSWPSGVSGFDTFNDYTWQRRLAEKT